MLGTGPLSGLSLKESSSKEGVEGSEPSAGSDIRLLLRSREYRLEGSESAGTVPVREL